MDLDGGSRLRANMRNLRAVKRKDRGETKPSDGNLRLGCQALSSQVTGENPMWNQVKYQAVQPMFYFGWDITTTNSPRDRDGKPTEGPKDRRATGISVFIRSNP